MIDVLKFKPTGLSQEDYARVMREVDEVAIEASHIIRVGDISCYPVPVPCATNRGS